MALCCIISEKKRYISRKSRFRASSIRRLRYGGPRRSFAIFFGKEKLEWRGYAMVEKNLRICLAMLTEYTGV